MLTSHNQLVRALQKVNFNGRCWLWYGHYSNGYGRIKHDGRMQGAHRVLWETFNGSVPLGMHLDHLCRNKGCVRPSHLEPVTPRENTLRGIGPAAKNAVKVSCKYGHEFSARNLLTYKDRSGRMRRDCRECMKARSRKYRAHGRVAVFTVEP